MKTYQLASDYWRGPYCVILDSDERGDHIATFPVEFLRRCGDNTWSYIHRVIAELITKEDATLAVITDGNGSAVDLNEGPSAGVFVLKRKGPSASVTFSPGPHYFSAFKAPNPEGSFSTRSDSKDDDEDEEGEDEDGEEGVDLDNGNQDDQDEDDDDEYRGDSLQSRFRRSVVARDGICIVSGAHYTSCTASHIVPYSRPDVYDTIYGVAGGQPLFRASSGLLLRYDLRNAFDRLEMSLYVKGDTIYVHFFSNYVPGATEFHGKAIPQSWFRGHPGELPDPELLHWHYSQCVKARIRGFSVDMS